MQRLEQYLSRRTGAVQSSELQRAGFTHDQIAYAVAQQRIRRIRNGWFASKHCDEMVVQAARIGGILCGLSAAKFHGLWVPPFRGLHVSVPANSPRLRSPQHASQSLKEFLQQHPDTVTVHWDLNIQNLSYAAEPVPQAVSRIVRDGDLKTAFTVLESAQHQRKMGSKEFRNIMQQMNPVQLAMLENASAASESGIESLMKIALIQAKIPFTQQVVIEQIGRVDFLLANHLVVEVDGSEFHHNQYRDRKRDQILLLLGYRVMRFVYAQVMYEIEQSIQSIMLELERLAAD